MMDTKSTHRGHDMELVHGNWLYTDTKQLVSDNALRDCGHCGLASTEEGHDGCLGTLSGVMNACCGHGVESEAYVQFEDGTCCRGEFAAIAIEKLKEKT